jgi:hypothetical protein
MSQVSESSNRKSSVFIINQQIATPQVSTKNTAQLCLITVINFVFYSVFYIVQILIRLLNALFVTRKSMYFRTCGTFKSANYKKDWGPQITNPPSVTIAEGPQI